MRADLGGDAGRYGAALLASALSASVVGAYVLARSGAFPIEPAPLATLLGIAWLLFCVPVLVSDWLRRRAVGDPQWYTSEQAIGVVLFAAICLFGTFRPLPGVQVAGALLAVTGAVCLAVVISRWVRRVRVGGRGAALAAGGFLVLVGWFLGAVWARGWSTPFFSDLIGRMNGHIDVLFNAAVTNMFRTFGSPATGIDGVRYLHYHWASNWAFAQLCNLTGLSALRFYEVGFAAVVFPWFVQLAVRLASVVRRRFDGNACLGPRGYLVMLAGLVGIIPTPLLTRAWYGTGGPTSENWILSSALAFAFLAMVLESGMSRLDSEPVRADRVFAVVVVPPMLVVLGLTKVSYLVLGLAMLTYWTWRSRLWRDRWQLAGLAASWVVSMPTLLAVSAGGGARLAPLDFIRWVAWDYSDRGWPLAVVGYFLLNYLWLGLYVAARARDTKRVPSAGARRGLAPDVEMLAVLAVVSALPGLVLFIPGGSAGYFSDVQRLLSIVLLAAYAPVVVRRVADPPAAEARRRLRLGVAVALALMLAVNAVLGVGAVARVVGQGRAVARTVEKPAAIIALEHAAATPWSEKRSAVVFVPRDTPGYWYNLLRRLDGPSFLVPAITAMAGVDGLPDPTYHPAARGYEDYRAELASRAGRPHDLPSAVSRAHALGFSSVLEVEGPGVVRH